MSTIVSLDQFFTNSGSEEKPAGTEKSVQKVPEDDWKPLDFSFIPEIILDKKKPHRLRIYKALLEVVPENFFDQAVLGTLVHYIDCLHVYENLADRLFGDDPWTYSTSQEVQKMTPVLGAWQATGKQLSALEQHLGISRNSRNARGFTPGQNPFSPENTSVLLK